MRSLSAALLIGFFALALTATPASSRGQTRMFFPTCTANKEFCLTRCPACGAACASKFKKCMSTGCWTNPLGEDECGRARE